MSLRSCLWAWKRAEQHQSERSVRSFCRPGPPALLLRCGMFLPTGRQKHLVDRRWGRLGQFPSSMLPAGAADFSAAVCVYACAAAFGDGNSARACGCRSCRREGTWFPQITRAQACLRRLDLLRWCCLDWPRHPHAAKLLSENGSLSGRSGSRVSVARVCIWARGSLQGLSGIGMFLV